MKRSSTDDVLETFCCMRRYGSALSRKSAPLCLCIVPASLLTHVDYLHYLDYLETPRLRPLQDYQDNISLPTLPSILPQSPRLIFVIDLFPRLLFITKNIFTIYT